MHILHIIQRYYPARGGAEQHMGKISSHLVAQGHQVTVATTDALDFELFWNPRRRRIAVYESWKDGVHILRFPVRHMPVPTLSYPAVRRLLWLMSAVKPIPVTALNRLARFTPWVPQLWQWLETTSTQFDLVAGMTICFEPLLEAGLLFARKRHIPYVSYPLTHLGAGEKPAADALSRFYTMRHQIQLVKASDAVVAQTRDEADFYNSLGIPADDIIQAGPGIDPEEVLGGNAEAFRRHHQINHPIILSISAMAYDKGTIHTVEAVRQLWRAGSKMNLVLIGSVLEPFQRYLNKLPSVERRRIMVLGQVDEKEKRDALAACDMLVMPSRTDSFGIVYLEAWLYEKPVIGADTWGVKDVITDGKDGILIPFGDVSALVQAISFLLNNPDTARNMGQQGKKKAYQWHTWSRKVTLSLELYEKLVARWTKI